MRVLGMIMAGGEGKRLSPLTAERAKPAVPFAGKCRIIDFALSNFINSGIYGLYVLTQFKAQSLVEHLQEGWQFGGILADHFVIPVPAQMRRGRVCLSFLGRNVMVHPGGRATPAVNGGGRMTCRGPPADRGFTSQAPGFMTDRGWERRGWAP